MPKELAKAMESPHVMATAQKTVVAGFSSSSSSSSLVA